MNRWARKSKAHFRIGITAAILSVVCMASFIGHAIFLSPVMAIASAVAAVFFALVAGNEISEASRLHVKGEVFQSMELKSLRRETNL